MTTTDRIAQGACWAFGGVTVFVFAFAGFAFVYSSIFGPPESASEPATRPQVAERQAAAPLMSREERCSYFTQDRRAAFEELRRQRDAGLLTGTERTQA